MRLQNVVDIQEAEIMSKKNVFAMGVSTKIIQGQDTEEPCLTVFVPPGTKSGGVSKADRVPSVMKVDGKIYKTDVIELEPPEPLTMVMSIGDRKRRPFMAGDEIGPKSYAQTGTIGLIFRARTAEIGGYRYDDYGLTNYHVLRSILLPKERFESEVILGMSVTQPAGGEVVGHVVRALSPIPDGVGDAALIRLTCPGGNPPQGTRGFYAPGSTWDLQAEYMVQDAMRRYLPRGAPLLGFPHYHKNFNGLVRGERPTDQRSYYPTPAGLGVTEVGERVWKSGRTTGITRGTVRATNLIVAMYYGFGQVVMRRQILIQPDAAFDDKTTNGANGICAAGDSGSVVIDAGNGAVGLAFSGNKVMLVATPIQRILNKLFFPEELAPYDLNREGGGIYEEAV